MVSEQTCATLFAQVRLLYLIFAVPQTQADRWLSVVTSTIDGTVTLLKERTSFFDCAGDSTGGVKDVKGLWLACQSTGNSTGGLAHGQRQCCVLFF